MNTDMTSVVERICARIVPSIPMRVSPLVRGGVRVEPVSELPEIRQWITDHQLMCSHRRPFKAMCDAVFPRHHATTDQLAVLRALPDRATYARMLACMYGFHQPAHAVLAEVPAIGQALDVERLPPVASLKTDLNALGLDPAGIRCAEVPRPAGVPKAFGLLFTLAGSAFGGRRITGGVQARDPQAPTNFFQDTGGLSCRHFGQVVDELVTGSEQADRAAAPALATLERFGEWIDTWRLPRPDDARAVSVPRPRTEQS